MQIVPYQPRASLPPCSTSLSIPRPRLGHSYRVMRLGTKARDGLSGEGQTIFSYGFGEVPLPCLRAYKGRVPYSSIHCVC